MDLAALSRLLENLIRFGTIYEVDYEQPRVRVLSGEITTDWLPYFVPRAGKTKDWDPPTIGEQCMVLSPSGELAGGAVLVGLNSNDNPAPSDNPDLTLRRYPDDAVISYNHATGELMATGIKTALVEASESILIDCPLVTFTGKVVIQNLLTYQAGMVGSGGDTTAVINGDVIANGISLTTHRHPGDSGGITGQPNA